MKPTTRVVLYLVAATLASIGTVFLASTTHNENAVIPAGGVAVFLFFLAATTRK